MTLIIFVTCSQICTSKSHMSYLSITHVHHNNQFQSTFDKRDFYSISRILLCCTYLGRDWLSKQSAVAGPTFMNEFASYAKQAPPFKRRIRQRFTDIDYTTSQWIIIIIIIIIHHLRHHKWISPCIFHTSLTFA